MLPLISCIMSNYNTNINMLRKALDSVLNQTYDNFEIIIIDDCSTDEESRKVIKEYEAKDERIKPYYKKKNEGLAAALNYGIRKASGKYIVRFDTDDICFSRRFEIQIDYMEKHPNINISSSFVEIFDGKKGIVATAFNDEESVKAQLLFSCYIPHSAVIMQKNFLIQNELFYDPQFEKAEDFDLWTRCVEKGAKISIIPKVLIKYRIHSSSVCHVQKTEQVRLTNIIVERQLDHLKIKPSKEEMKMHKILCGIENFEEQDFNKLDFWCHRLVKQNNEIKYYDVNKFKKVVINRQSIAILKSRVTYKKKIFCMVKKNKMCNIYNIYALLYKKIHLLKYKR